MAPWQCFLSLTVVAASVAVSLGAIIIRAKKRRRRLPRSAAAPPPPWMSCGSRVPLAWLLAFRATAAVALAAVLAWDVRTYDPSIMVYYTEWTLLLEIAYFTAATLCSAYGCLMTYSRDLGEDEDPEGNDDTLLCRSGDDDAEPNPNCNAWKGAGRWGLLMLMMQIAYQVSAGAVVLTDAVFWGLIVPFISSSSAHSSPNAVMGCIHSLNLVFLLTETALNNLAFPWFGVSYFILWTSLYVIIQWIAHFCGFTWWPYPFLRPASSLAPLWYFALASLHLPCYLVYWLVVRAKNGCVIHMQDADRS